MTLKRLGLFINGQSDTPNAMLVYRGTLDEWNQPLFQLGTGVNLRSIVRCSLAWESSRSMWTCQLQSWIGYESSKMIRVIGFACFSTGNAGTVPFIGHTRHKWLMITPGSTRHWMKALKSYFCLAKAGFFSPILKAPVNTFNVPYMNSGAFVIVSRFCVPWATNWLSWSLSYRPLSIYVALWSFHCHCLRLLST